jgi:hypothetical protein
VHFPIERDWTDGAFDGIVVELDTASVDQARRALPTELAIWLIKPSFARSQCSNALASGWLFLLPDETPRLGAKAANVLLDGMKFGNAPSARS